MGSMYDEKYIARTQAIEDILWNETDGIYYDYQISAKQQNKYTLRFDFSIVKH